MMWRYMQIQRRTLLAYAVVVAMGGTAAYGQDISTVLISQLEEDGYSVVLIENTWLGRIRIVAEKTGGTREIVLNPRTGEILRDLWTVTAGGSSSASGSGSGAGTGSGTGSGSGTGGTGTGTGSGSGAGSGGSGGSGEGSGSGSGHGEDPEDQEDPEDPDDEAEDESEGR